MQSWNQWGLAAGGAYNYQTSASSTLGSDLQGYPSSNYQYYSTGGAQDAAQNVTNYNQQQQYTIQQQQQWQQWTQWQQQFQQWQQQYGDKYQQAVGGLPGSAPVPPSTTTAQNGQASTATFNPSVQPPLPPLPPSEKLVNPPLPVDPPLPTTQPPLPPSSQAPAPPSVNVPPVQLPPLMSQPPPPPLHPQGQQMYQGSHASYFSGSYESGGAPDSNQGGYYGRPEDGYPPMYHGPAYSGGHGEGFGGGGGRKRPGDALFDSEIGGKKMRMDLPPAMEKRTEGEEGWNHWNKEGRGRMEEKGDADKQASAGKAKEVPPEDELSEAEKSFDAQFEQWESQFMRWKEQNKNHSDKNQYREYEAKWESWREQLLQRREQMKKKRENGKNLLSSSDTSRNRASPFPKNLPPITEEGEGRWPLECQPPKEDQVAGSKEKEGLDAREDSSKGKVDDVEPNTLGLLSSVTSENGIPGLDLVTEKPLSNKQEDLHSRGDGRHDDGKEESRNVVKDQDDRQDPWFRREDKCGSFGAQRDKEKASLLPSERREEGKRPWQITNEQGRFNQHDKPLHTGRPDVEESKNIWQNQQLHGPQGVFGVPMMQSPAQGQLDSDMRTDDNKMWKGELPDLFLPPPDLRHVDRDDGKQWQEDVFGGLSVGGRPMDSDMRTSNERIWQQRDHFEMVPLSGRQVESDMRDETSGPWQSREMYGPSDMRQASGRINVLNKPWQGRGPPEMFTGGMRAGNDGPQQQSFKSGPQGMIKQPPFMDNSRFPHGDMRHPMQSEPKHPHGDYDREDPKDVYGRGRGEWGNEEGYGRPQWRDEPSKNKRFDPPCKPWDDYRGRPLIDESRPLMDEEGNERPYEDERYMMTGQQERWEVPQRRASPPEREWAAEFVAPTVVDYGHMPRQDPQIQPAPRIPSPRIPTPPRDFSGNVQTFDYCHGASRNPLPFAVDSVQREQWRGSEYGERREGGMWENDSPSRGRNLDAREVQRRESRWEKPRWSNPKHNEGDPPRWEEEERYIERWSGSQARKERDRERWRKGRQRGEEGSGGGSRGSNNHDSDKERSSRHKKEESGNSSSNRNGSNNNGSSSHPLVSYPLPAATPPPPFISQPSLAKVETILIEDLLVPPGRATRPPRIVIILRGPPGSGKTFVAKLVKDKEVEQGGSAPRILSLDDYFMVEFEKEEKDPETGRKVTKKFMMYEYEAEMEKQYRNSLVKAFRKTVDDGYFPFIIVDCVNDKVRQFDEMWTYAKQKGFQVYICEMDMDVPTCSKRNTHGRSQRDIEDMVKHWEETPRSYIRVDVRSLLQSVAITEVEMEDTTEEKPKEESADGDVEKVDAEEKSKLFLQDAEKNVARSKWDGMEASEEKLDRLDGLARKRKSENHPQSLEDWLQLTDDYEKRKCTPGKKQVRWADLEERRQQERIRAIGFVVGQTDWSRMTDPTFGEGALTQTKYI